MLIWNPTQEVVTVKVAGNYFTLKPDTRKRVNDDIAHFISTDRKESGLVVLPVEFEEEPELLKSAEGKVVLDKLKEEAIDHLIRFHRRIIANNQVSLRRDLEQANIKTDPAIEASEGELNSMRIVAKYQRSKQDAEQARAEEVKKLMQEVNKR